MKRTSLSKKARFEVFKRDSFTCQYCGKKAPDILLQADHIKPVSKGGTNDILNLVTSCVDCNQGKSDRELSDSTVIDKQREQLEALQERKEQIELMFEWQKSLLELEDHVDDQIAEYWSENVPGYVLNESGKKAVHRLRGKYEIGEILSGIKLAAEKYLDWVDGEPTKESVELAWKKVGGICHMKRLDNSQPELKRLYYIRGIMRNRFHYCDDRKAMELLKQSVQLNASVDSLEECAKDAKNWSSWKAGIENFINDQLEEQEGEPDELSNG
jgi:hypothetical protein